MDASDGGLRQGITMAVILACHLSPALPGATVDLAASRRSQADTMLERYVWPPDRLIALLRDTG